MRDHITSKHENLKLFKCDTCDKSFSVQNNLMTHIKVKHAKDQKHTCHFCQEKFPLLSYLKSHIAKVHEITYNKCNICEKTFKSSLNLHIRNVHQEGKKLKCNLCDIMPDVKSKGDQFFMNNYQLKRHMESVHLKNLE